jgi:surface polysaccharide O-acyltransferase-like enzyme
MFLGGAASGHIDEYLGGMNWRALLTCIWFSFACISFSISLTLWLRNRTAANSRLAGLVAKANFGAYLIHPLVLVSVCYAISHIALPGLAKFAIALIITVPLTYLLADALRRIPGLNRIF